MKTILTVLKTILTINTAVCAFMGLVCLAAALCGKWHQLPVAAMFAAMTVIGAQSIKEMDEELNKNTKKWE